MKPIPNFPDYFADEEGNIYSQKPKYGKLTKSHHLGIRKMFPYRGNHGYHMVLLRRGKKRKLCSVHRLVLFTFSGLPPKDKPFACHGLNGKTDNNVNNLYWGNRSTNAMDKHRDGTMPCGEKSWLHKLNSTQVRIIRRLYESGKEHGITQQSIADLFGVCQVKVSEIIMRKSWKHLA